MDVVKPQITNIVHNFTDLLVGLKYDYHVAAHALFERGSYCVQSEDRKDEGKKMLLKAKDGFKEYDFENRLNVRIRNMLKALETPVTPTAK